MYAGELKGISREFFFAQNLTGNSSLFHRVGIVRTDKTDSNIGMYVFFSEIFTV